MHKFRISVLQKKMRRVDVY